MKDRRSIADVTDFQNEKCFCSDFERVLVGVSEIAEQLLTVAYRIDSLSPICSVT